MIAASEAYAWQEWAAAALESHCCAIKIAIDTRDSVLTLAGRCCPHSLSVLKHPTEPSPSRAILVPSSVACCLLHVVCCLFRIVRHAPRCQNRCTSRLPIDGRCELPCPQAAADSTYSTLEEQLREATASPDPPTPHAHRSAPGMGPSLPPALIPRCVVPPVRATRTHAATCTARCHVARVHRASLRLRLRLCVSALIPPIRGPGADVAFDRR